MNMHGNNTSRPSLEGRIIDASSFRPGSSFLQSVLWARQKEAFGWKGHFVRVELAGSKEHSLDVLVLTKALRLGWHLAYVPHGPELSGMDTLFGPDSGLDRGQKLALLGKHIRKLLGLRLTALRFDLEWDLPHEVSAVAPASEASSTPAEDGENTCADDLADPESVRKSQSLKPLGKSSADIQPPDTVVVDISGDEAAILGAMKSKTRYNVRLSAKKGVEVVDAGLEGLDTWYELYLETAKRDRIGIHGREYYRRLLSDNPGSTSLLLARHEGDVLAGVILMFHGKAATYLYGASSNAKRNLMPSYALQWEGMKLAKSRGCTSYDLFGIPPSSDPAHPMHGLYQVKTGYGGRIVHRYGTWDLICSPLVYGGFFLYEKIRFFVLRRLKKRLG